MARQRTRQPAVPNGFVSSAVRLPTATRKEAGQAAGWQTQAWQYFDSVGELRYLSNWIGNVLSRAELYAAKREENELVPVTTGPARDAMDALYGGPQGQSQMLQLLGVDTTVSGEGYIIARTVDGEDKWDVLTTGKVVQGNKGKLEAQFGAGTGRVTLTDKDLVIRVWTPHPTDPTVADAPTRSNMKTLAQICGYDDHISAQLTSRLAGAGLLLMPSEIQFAAPQGDDPEASQSDSLIASLAEAAAAAIANRNSPAAFIPIMVTAPGEFLDKIQHLTFWSDLDDKVIDMRTSAIRRFAIGMDVPPEVLLGNADANHWNAWLSEESAIKAHLEPRLGVINHGLTTSYLRPALKGLVPDGELDDWYVIADTTNIRVRPNKSEQALELHDRGLIKADSVRRETGFKPEDKMSEDDFAKWLLQRIATGAVTPELTAEALRILGANISTNLVVPDNVQLPPDQSRSDTEIVRERGTPQLDTTEEPLVAACEVLVFRALERAGNKLRNAHPRTDTTAMAAHMVYLTLAGDSDQLLAGAWDCAPEVLKDYKADVSAVVTTLDFYVRGLLQQKRPHSRTTLAHLIAASTAEAIISPP